MTIPFLTAEWRRLALVTFAVPDAALAPHLPPGIVPDRWEGSAVASLVAFEFLNTKIFGVPVYGFRNFPEWNLRFYVKDETGRRGVGFVKELVPGRVCATIARVVYNEPYETVRYDFDRQDIGGGASLEHVVTVRGRRHRIAFQAAGEPSFPGEETLAHFLKEQDWGYGTTRGGRRAAYHVTHPRWRVYPETSFEVDVDAHSLYGEGWAFLNDLSPISRIVAEGSSVKVYPRIVE